MDFVVVGLGIGAFAVLLGLAIRDVGPFFRRIPRDGSMAWAVVAERVAWGRRCRAAGLVVALSGAVLCLVTGISLLARVSDPTGMWIVLAALVVALIAIAAWAYRYQTIGRTPSMPATLDEPVVDDKPAPRPARKSALAGIRSSTPNLSRRNVDAEHAAPVDDVAAPMGTLTVDATGAMRRTPLGAPSEPTPSPDRPSRSTPATTPEPAKSQRSESQLRKQPRNTGRGGPGDGQVRR